MLAIERLTSLLTYIEQVEKLKRKPAFAIPTEPFTAFQHELKGLPEVRFNLDDEGDDVWLRIPRLEELPPPDAGDVLSAWLTLPKNIEQKPVLKPEVAVMDGRVELSRLSLTDHPQIQEQFDWYVSNQWEPWAAGERPRRRTMASYNQLFALQQTMSAEGAETALELVWGLGYATWKKPGQTNTVRHPLVVQSCDVALDVHTGDLSVRPRDVDAKLEVDCYAEMEIAGVTPLEAFWRAAQESQASRVNPFETTSYEALLKAAVNHLDPSGHYEARTDDVSVPIPSDRLKVTNTWVLFARKRPADILLEDVRRLKAKLETATDIPQVIKSFVERGSDEVRVQPEQTFRGLSTSDASQGAFELYFPLPYNQEQVSIVQKLERNPGVVVQGPPGTGKSHTIANIVCHYLAQGKRVLVTAKGETALSVVQEKMPERVRALTVALLSDEKGGRQQFEHAIQTIASTVARLNPSQYGQRITAAESTLNDLHAKIAEVDRQVTDFAVRHMKKYSFQGREVSPEDMAKTVMAEAGDHLWFDDSPPTSQDELPFTNADVNCVRAARLEVGDQLAYLGCRLPMADEFPAWTDMLGLHRDLVRAHSIDKSVSQGTVLPLVDNQPATYEKAVALGTFLTERFDLRAKLDALHQPWVSALEEHFWKVTAEDPRMVALAELGERIEALETERRSLLAQAIEVTVDVELNPEFMAALQRLMAGNSAFWLPFGQADNRRLVAAVRVMGVAPAAQAQWRQVYSVLHWRDRARAAIAQWRALAADFDLPNPEGAVESAFKNMAVWQMHRADVETFTIKYRLPLHARLEEVFGTAVADRVGGGGETTVASAHTSILAHIDRGRLGYTMARVRELTGKLTGCSGTVVDHLHSFLSQRLGRPDQDETVMQTMWGALILQLTQLASLRPALSDIHAIATRIESAGAPLWAARIRSEVATGPSDPVVPSSWFEAWRSRQAYCFLEQIDGHDQMRRLFERRHSMAATLASTYQDLIADKTWLEVHNKSPESVRQALQAFLGAIHAIGAGTGVRATRHRRNARTAMQQAYQAVPCWVLPTWRVSETIPAEVGLFDLVIIDEASQSDIWALPALLRGKKILVVGDHKQVSPSAVGMAEERLLELSRRFLSDQPHGVQMMPDRSVYDLASVVFAGNSVMLREHFRCVPAIIEFSNRHFYQGDIQPLRLPKSSERLDPPLIDVFVKGAYRKGDTNPAEAKAIVDEIEAVIADPQYKGRSIGVVTLRGTDQAAHIHKLLMERIAPADFVAREMRVGAPPVFQGNERDIIFISMVIAPGDRAAAARADMEQRFNVALSRARDRVYLFRSVPDGTFGADSLNGKLVEHFKRPFVHDERQRGHLRDRCESEFEKEMFDALTQRGYRVEPQVPVAGFRLDFVVEGREGRRLAVECDGDRFHGPGQWSDDMARQRVLERAGWTFWRCFASTFTRRREEVMGDLFVTLEKLGIEPIGSDEVDNSVWVHSKTVDPFQVEVLDETEEADAPSPSGDVLTVVP